MFLFNQKLISYLVFFMAFAMFVTSIISQIFLEKEPCQLCLITRYMFLPIAIIALFSNFSNRFKIFLPIVIFLAVGFSFYHLGVENHWWRGPHGCVSELPTLDSIDNIDQLDSKKVYCDRVNWMVFGISSTLWSFLFSMFLFWISSLSFAINYYLQRIEEDDD